MKGYFINFNQRAMFIATAFICAFFAFGATHLAAQDKTLKVETPKSITELDESNGLTLTQEQLDEIKKYIPAKQECLNPEIENEATVRYQTSALVYLKWHKSDGEPNIYLQDGQKRTYQPLKTEFGDLIFQKLPLDQSYQLIGKNSCGGDVILKTISTARPTVNEILLADDFYNAMTSWTINPKDVPLSRFLKDLKGINYYERLAFFQVHLLRNEPLSDKITEGEFPETKSESNATAASSLACDCTYLLNRQRDASPGTAASGNYANNGDFYAHYSPNWYPIQASPQGVTMRAYSVTGPAKWQEQNSVGACSSYAADWETDDSQSTNGSPYYAKIGYNLLCTNWPQLPAGCACEKQVIVAANYTTRLNTDAETSYSYIGACWGNRGANASAEDWAVLVEHKIRSAEVTVLQGGRTNASSKCSSSLNADFFVNYIKLAGTIAVKVLEMQAAQNGGNGQVNGLFPMSFVDDLATKLGTFINTPFLNTEPCGSQQKDAQLIGFQGFRTLTPNNPVEYTLSSMSKLHTYGYTRWKARSRIISKFMIASILDPAGSNVSCCSAPMANWISSTISPDFSSIRPSIQSFFGLYWPTQGNRPIISTDFGSANGATAPNCIPPSDLRNGENSSSFMVRSQGEGVYLTQKSANQPYECIISDVMGRVIYRHNGSGQEEKVWDYSNINASNTPSTGIYLVQVKTLTGESQTFKIVKK